MPDNACEKIAEIVLKNVTGIIAKTTGTAISYAGFSVKSAGLANTMHMAVKGKAK